MYIIHLTSVIVMFILNDMARDYDHDYKTKAAEAKAAN